MKTHFLLVIACPFFTIASLSIPCHAQNFNVNEDQFSRKGYSFEFNAKGVRDEQSITDPITQKEVTKVIYGHVPSAVNGKKIYEAGDATTAPVYNSVRASPSARYATDTSLDEYLLYHIAKETRLKQLPDGTVRVYLNDVIIDGNGKVIFFDFSGCRYLDKNGLWRSLYDYFIPGKLDSLMSNAQPMTPATLNGEKIAVRLNTSLSRYKLEVKDHKITYFMDRKTPPLK